MSDPVKLIDKETALRIHAAAIEHFGGCDGIRDERLLESALAQPFQTFDGAELHPSIAEKAARYAWGIACNHPFADGNKRTAAAVMGAFLRINECSFRPRHDELLAAMTGIAGGSISLSRLAKWIELNISDE
jgi:death on curing protein